jgi:hypothetical protein
VEILSKYWITTAEQVIALVATENGRESLAKQLEIDVATLDKYLRETRAALPAERVRSLETPVDTSSWGFGARPPRRDDRD